MPCIIRSGLHGLSLLSGEPTSYGVPELSWANCDEQGVYVEKLSTAVSFLAGFRVLVVSTPLTNSALRSRSRRADHTRQRMDTESEQHRGRLRIGSGRIHRCNECFAAALMTVTRGVDCSPPTLLRAMVLDDRETPFGACATTGLRAVSATDSCSLDADSDGSSLESTGDCRNEI
jgi:hypothetical protein